jgi:methionine--tRNA ligase beta chain
MFSRSLLAIDRWLAEFAPAATATAAAAGAAVGAAAVSKSAPKSAPAAAASAESPASPAAPASPASEAGAGAGAGSAISKIAFIVGKVLEVAPHPESEHLYVEKIDLGEASGPRSIISGLREHVAEKDFVGRNVIVVANLEPRKMRGIVSEGMVLCASTDGKGKVCLLDVPPAAPAGERIMFPGHDGPAEPVLKKKLAKLWDDVAPTLRTDAAGVATCSGMPFRTSAGPVTCAAIPNGSVS